MTALRRFFNIGLGKFDIMGINARNSDYIFEQNARRFYPLVDDKLQTKQLALKSNIQVPELYGTIAFFNDASKVKEIAAPHTAFVIKPAQGSGGDGITLIRDVTEEGFVTASGDIMSENDMHYYITNILSGMYSMGNTSDKAILEYVVVFDPVFESITYRGVPDIRIIVYKGIPLMAMLRLPTRESGGKANLHKGGIGVGVNMANGVTLSGVQHNRFIDKHPETKNALSGHQIPGWDNLLSMAAKFYDITGLGYVGVDIVLDKTKGPMVLEANARPGIAIQIANMCGLKSRTNQVDNIDISQLDLHDRVDFAKQTFGL